MERKVKGRKEARKEGKKNEAFEEWGNFEKKKNCFKERKAGMMR